jgi:hypothetical protein
MTLMESCFVSDSGGELASGEFSEFCDEQSIPNQFVIDCTDIAVSDIYTGCVDDNVDLLTLLHKVFDLIV